jgi:capsular exopolysaccharide synthesis family protein
VDKVSLQELDIMHALQIIKKKWYVVLIFTSLALVFCYYKGYHKTTTVYQVKVDLMVGNPNGSDIAQVQVLERYIETYCGYAKTDFIAKKVSDKLNKSISVETILSSVMVVPRPNTQFMNISLTWDTPDNAQKILKTFYEVFIDELKKMYPTTNIQAIESYNEPKPILISKKSYFFAIPIAAMVLAILIVLGVEMLDNTLKTDEDVKKYLSGSVIGEIPREKEIITNINAISIKNISHFMIETFRTLRTNIEFITSCNNLKSIIVTSSRPEEGKTLTAAMLATVLAQTYKRTILIDCDLRNPSIHKLFTITNITGLTNYLVGKASLPEIINKADIENLYVITSGIKPPNPAELLSTTQMKTLIRILRNDYDYIIIDTPPVGLVTDAQVLSQITDGSIFIVSSGKSVKEDTVKSKELLKQVGGKIVGFVLNNVKYLNKYKKYSYYYQGGKRRK